MPVTMRQRLRLGQRAVAQMPRQRSAADVLHDDIIGAAGLIERRIHHRDHIGMPDARGQLRLADEALAQGRIVQRQRRGKNLDRHLNLQRLVIGEVNGAHAAAAQFANDPAPADDIARLDFAHQRWHEHSFT